MRLHFYCLSINEPLYDHGDRTIFIILKFYNISAIIPTFPTSATSATFSSSVNRMLKLKPQITSLMRCNIGDGKTASFWFDWWTDLGPLITVFGNRGPRNLRIPIDRSMRDRLLSLPPPSQGSLSLLSLYFSIRSSSPP